MSGVVTGMGTSITRYDMLHFLDSVEYVEDKVRSAVKPVEYRPESATGLGVVRAWMAFISLLETSETEAPEHGRGWSEHQQSPCLH